MKYINDNIVLSENKFRFRSIFSTTDQLLITYNDISSYIDQGLVVDLIFFNYSKAFDDYSKFMLFF